MVVTDDESKEHICMADRMAIDNLKRARTSCGMTQAQAAEAVGVTLRTWHRWEHGQSAPKGLQARALAAWVNENA